jgi:hypothetical protein
LLYAIALITVSSHAKDGWEITANFGTSFSKDETLTIKGSGGKIVLNNANFETKPFSSPLYYGVRVSRWENDSAWEVEHIHQKIYINDLPEEVQHFEITDGYNLFYLNHAWNLEKYGIITRIGAGFVVAHPQITVRDVETYTSGGGAIPMIWDTSSGYQWAGFSGQLAVEKEFQVYENWYISLEGKLTHSKSDIDLENGSVEVPNTALHLHFGIKYQFNQ